MTEEIKAQDGGPVNTVKLVIAILFVLAGVAGFYLLGNQAAWLRWLAVVVGLVLCAVVIATSQYGTDLRQFIAASRVELRKIVWPGRQETGMTTVVVFVFVVAAGLFFWGLDLVLAWATRALTGQGS
ncbi:MAG: preprotein translocase subunit SecE [Steroidobacteraceae bacterium]